MRMNKLVAPVKFRPWLTVVLAFVLTLSSFAGLAYADDAVTGISFENSPSMARVYIDDDAVQVDVVASISGSASTKNVTLNATWSTSNSSIVKVTSGLLTAVAKGTATISANYQGYKISLPVTVDYLYDSVTIKNDGTAVDSAINVKLGDTIVYSLMAAKSGANDQDFTADATWTSSNTSAATVEDGEVTLLAAGETTITGKYKGRTDTVKLTITSPYKSLTLTQEDGTKPDLLEFNIDTDSQQLTATAVTTDGTPSGPIKVVWTSSSTAVATVDNGAVTPVGVGTATITASYLGVSSSTMVVVRPAYEAMRITPKEDQHITLKDTPIQFKLDVFDGNDTPIPVTSGIVWTSSNVYAATVSSDGVVFPKGVGATIIKASYKGLTQQLNVTVYPTITSITAAKISIDAFVDDSNVTLPKVSATSLAGDTVDVSNLTNWTSSDTTVFEKADGKWTAKKAGTAVLTAVVQGKTVTIKVNVHEHPLLLTSDQTNLSVVIGKDTKLPTITMTYDTGEEEDVTSLVTWKSSSSNLLVKAPNIKGIQAASATLSATYLGKSVTVRVTIEEEITKLTIDNTTLTFSPERSATLKVTGVYKSGKTIALGAKMNWSINPESLATIKGSSMKTLKEGTGTLTGEYQGKSVSVTISVIGKLRKLTPSSKALTLAPEGSETVKVVGEYEGGRLTDLSKAVVWTTGNSKVAVVTDGVITAVAKGSTNIRATIDGKSATIRVSVK
ncbi:bacterial surface protein [Paenibacillus rhizovicinus]|uniref:Bacterial surface protein n=1 Tax=Paenibacillus rhizovicinus TaxID=2704463 RepID=A0A6C0P1Z9_9BACL|nr:bacterial surface protein [Paenibacillus rhizovicinus]QHW32570.1 bacterial surface protein [Paenibacillus rhizovicinus]